MRRVMTSQSPDALRPWLHDRGSLTKRLQQRSGGHFCVQVLAQRWEKPRLSEAAALGVSWQRRSLIREVLLCGAGQPWVYARSVIPLSVLHGELGYLRRLGSRPLGALLFGNPAIRREPISVRRWRPEALPAVVAAAVCTPLWGRQSVFRHRDGGILVAEVFLPALLDSLP